MNDGSVTFATKCYEMDWKKIVFGGFQRKVAACQYPFERKVLVINNVIDQDGVREAARWVTPDFCFAHPDSIQSQFRLNGPPNVFASGELAAVGMANSDYSGTGYLCYVQGDCITSGGDWVTPAIKVLRSEPDVMVVSPASEVNTWNDEEGYDRYMSDHAFVVRVKDFINPEFYAVAGIDSDYPLYGGNSFEHMVGKYLKATGKKRKILTDFYVQHPAY